MWPFGNRKPRETKMECTHIVPWSFLHRNAEQCTHCNLPVRTNISAMTVTQDIPKMIYPGTGTAHIVICSSFLAWPEPILYAHPATIACDPRFSTTKKDSKWCSLWHFLTVTFMMVRANRGDQPFPRFLTRTGYQLPSKPLIERVADQRHLINLRIFNWRVPALKLWVTFAK